MKRTLLMLTTLTLLTTPMAARALSDEFIEQNPTIRDYSGELIERSRNREEKVHRDIDENKRHSPDVNGRYRKPQWQTGCTYCHPLEPGYFR